MKHLHIYKLLFIIIFLQTINLSSAGRTTYKKLQINGLIIYTEKALVKQAGIPRLKKNKFYYKIVSERIIKFYREKGFTLAKVYLISETRNLLSVYIDEGRMMRIIYKGLNSIDVLKMKYEFQLEHNIYNKHIVKKETSRIKRKYNYKSIRIKLERAVKGDEAFFQLDNTFSLPWIGNARLPFFSRYSPRYNLVLYFKNKDSKKSRGLSLGLSTSYSKGLIPKAQYNIPGLFKNNDRFIISASMGWLYGLDFKFKEYPKWTFIELNTNYHFAPLFSN